MFCWMEDLGLLGLGGIVVVWLVQQAPMSVISIQNIGNNWSGQQPIRYRVANMIIRFRQFQPQAPNLGWSSVCSRILPFQNFVGVTTSTNLSQYNIIDPYHYCINKIMSHTKKPKPTTQRPLDSLVYDKGKRHFWNREKRDYGFFQSEESYLPTNHYSYIQNPQQPLHKRRHSTIGTHDHDGYQLYHDNARNSVSQNGLDKYKRNMEMQKEKKELNLVSHNIEIKLPAISKNPNRVNTQDSENFTTKQVNNPKPTHVSPDRELAQRPKERIKTQSNAYSQRGRKIRFSPTYVCSFNNPLPTFKLYDTGTSRPLYQYGFSEERA